MTMNHEPSNDWDCVGRVMIFQGVPPMVDVVGEVIKQDGMRFLIENPRLMIWTAPKPGENVPNVQLHVIRFDPKRIVLHTPLYYWPGLEFIAGYTRVLSGIEIVAGLPPPPNRRN